MNFVTGREQENVSRAKELYQRGDALFRQAKSQPEKQAKATYVDAAKLFERAGEAAPGRRWNKTPCSCRARVCSLPIA